MLADGRELIVKSVTQADKIRGTDHVDEKMKLSTLQRTAEGFRKGILGKGSSRFMCRAVCMPLQGYLSVIGYETELAQGTVDLGDYDMEHTWLRLVDGRILDPTADQFDELGLPPVYIGPLPEAYIVNQ